MEEEKKGTDFTTLICIALIALISIAFFIGAVMRYNKIEGANVNAILNDDETIDKIKDLTKSTFIWQLKNDNAKIRDGQENKIYPENNYVYTAEEYDTISGDGEYKWVYHNSLPFINIDSDEITKINEKWEEYFNDVKTEHIKSDKDLSYFYYYCIDYAYNITDNGILSIAIGTEDIDTSNFDGWPTSITIYNIDIESKKVLTTKEVLEKYNLDDDKMFKLIETGLKNTYKSLLDEYDDFNEFMEEVKYFSYAGKYKDLQTDEFIKEVIRKELHKSQIFFVSDDELLISDFIYHPNDGPANEKLLINLN